MSLIWSLEYDVTVCTYTRLSSSSGRSIIAGKGGKIAWVVA